ncbi:proline-rich receptor-like protein kinase PERK2 [Papaver somniferum]|uniref:proline-rich receptor-like protein kinase PERK2 n=1 Tax=Papaver somniferum TaxID=3469 RepID=UPI000E6FB644|nr:proline-rich receptor-like protein kinase PERK2 [Papaver somniferum]
MGTNKIFIVLSLIIAFSSANIKFSSAARQLLQTSNTLPAIPTIPNGPTVLPTMPNIPNFSLPPPLSRTQNFPTTAVPSSVAPIFPDTFSFLSPPPPFRVTSSTSP